MKGKLPAFYTKRLHVYLVVALITVSFIAGTSEAMFVPAAPQTQSIPPFDRAADLAKIQKTLESKALQQRLIDYGLSPAEALAKINGLSDEQIHQLAANIDALQAGGFSDSHIIIILLLIILIIILI
jgi:uncharacterized protein DUF6627